MKRSLQLVSLVPWLLLLPLLEGCGTAEPFSRGEVLEPSLTPSPTPNPGDDDSSQAGDDDATGGDDDTSTTATPGGDDDSSAPTPTPTPTPEPTPPPPSFASQVKPLLTVCTGCHASGSGASAWTYDGGSSAYAQVMLEVNVADPASSQLLIKASGGENHQGGSFYPTTSSGYKTILSWIEAGAPNN